MSQPTATYIITNARVITANPSQPYAEAVAIAGRHIVFVGSNADAQSWRSPSTRVIDAQGYTVLPGIIDSHYHLLIGSVELAHIQLGDVKTLNDLQETLSVYIADHPDENTYSGTGLSYSIMPNNQRLTRQHLDAIVSDRPLIMMAFDAHTVWVNTRAMEIAGILSDGKGDHLVKGEDGLPTGELREASEYAPILVYFEAWARLAKGFGGDAFAKTPTDAAYERQCLRDGLKLAAQYGVTSIHNMDGDLEQTSLYAAMEDTGELTLRVTVPYSVRPETTEQDLDEAVEMTRLYQSDMVRAGRAKFFMDGVVESWTALLLDEYADREGYVGEGIYSAEHFNRMAAACDRLGLQIAVHAVGDGAVRRTLDGYEYVQKVNGIRDSRHRIEHIELVHPDDLPRFAQLGVIAAMQPLHSPLSYPPEGHMYIDRVGRDRWHRAFAWQYVRGAGARLVFGSDWSVVSPNPMRGIYAALGRKAWAAGLPDHRQSLADTIASYTRDGAYTEFEEDTKGQIKTGMLADIVVLAADLEQTPVEEIQHIKVAITICDGRIVYEA